MEKIASSPSSSNWQIVPEKTEGEKLDLLKQSIQIFNQAWQGHDRVGRKMVFHAEPLLKDIEQSLKADGSSAICQTAKQVHEAFFGQLVCLGLGENDEALTRGMRGSLEAEFTARTIYEAIAKSGRVGQPKKLIRYLLLADKIEECRPLFQIFNTTLEAENLSAWMQ